MIYALLAAVLFAFVDIAWRYILPDVSIWRALFWRSLASSAVLIPLALWWEWPQWLEGFQDEAVWQVLLWPVLSGVVGLVLFTWALKLAPARLVVPIINLTGIGVWFWEWAWFDRVETAGLLGLLAVGLSLHGLMWWVLPAWFGDRPSRGDASGAMLSMGAVVVWSRGYVEYPDALEHIPPLSLAASVEWTMLVVGLAVAVFLPGRMSARNRSGAVWVGVGVAAAVASVTLAYSRIPASEVGLLSMLTPVLVVILARIVFQSPLRRRDIVAIASILLASGLHVLSLMR